MNCMIEKFTLEELADMAAYDAIVDAEFNRKVIKLHNAKKSPSVLTHGQAKRK